MERKKFQLMHQCDAAGSGKISSCQFPAQQCSLTRPAHISRPTACALLSIAFEKTAFLIHI